ncbi:hypothetical protein EMIT0180MI3_30574 [Priestia megaterium]
MIFSVIRYFQELNSPDVFVLNPVLTEQFFAWELGVFNERTCLISRTYNG